MRELIDLGWNRATRKAFSDKFGAKTFDEICFKANEAMEKSPLFRIRGCVENDDVFVRPELSEELINNLSNTFDSSQQGIPQDCVAKFKDKLISEFRDCWNKSVPWFKNEEIMDVEKICDYIQKGSDIDVENVTKKAYYQSLGGDVLEYDASTLSKTKNRGFKPYLCKNMSYKTREIIDPEERQQFLDYVSKSFKEEIRGVDELPNFIRNFVIEKDGKTIGYYSLSQFGDALEIGNYIILPEYRKTRHSLEAILTLRDEVEKFAKELGVREVKVEVDIDNPHLVGMYKKFGFTEGDKVTWNYIDDKGNHMTGGSYELSLKVN